MYYSTMCVGYGAVKSFCMAGGVTITFSVSGESFSIALSSICTHLQRGRKGRVGGWVGGRSEIKDYRSGIYCLLVAHHEVGRPIALLGEFRLIVQFEVGIIFGLSFWVQ